LNGYYLQKLLKWKAWVERFKALLEGEVDGSSSA